MSGTQLLCTFTDEESLEVTLRQIVECYDIAFNSIYILEDLDELGKICCTYNAYERSEGMIPGSTISLHRKKMTNTLYTINALNLLVEGLNGGVRDKRYQVPWNDYENCILVTAYGKLKIIRTNLKEIKPIEEIQ